jgi:hypothetical protein
MRILGLLFLAFVPQDTTGWTPLGEGTGVSGSAAALVLNYDVAPKKFTGAVMKPPADFAHMRSIRFSVKSDHDTALGVLLSEKKPGGNYAAWFWAPANVQQQVELTAADFSVTDGPGDPVDPDGKLDLDQVEGIGIFDMATFFLSMPANPDMPIAVTPSAGHHSLTVEGFGVTTGAGPSVRTTGLLDGFDRGFLDWVALGGMKLQLSAAGNPLGTRAMQASYSQQEGRMSLLVRRVGDPALAGAKRLSFDIASEHDVTLMVALEMKKPGGKGGEGPRFSLPIYPPGGKEVFHVDLNLADFKGPDGAFDPGQWRSIAILDATAAEGGGEQENTIWIGKIEARR